MKVFLEHGSFMETTAAMDQLLPFLEEATVTGRQLLRAMNCTDIETAEFIKNLWFDNYSDLKRVHDRHPKHTWLYYKQNNVHDLVEVQLYRKLLAKLYKEWYQGRTLEVKGKKEKRPNVKSGSDVPKGKSRKSGRNVHGAVQPPESDCDRDDGSNESFSS